MTIPIAQPDLGEEEIAAVAEVIRSGMIASGPKVAEFERRFADYCGTEYAIATSNGTTSLHAGMLAAGIGPGDEVIVPAFTFFATASSVSMCGATPVFADVDEWTFNLDPASVLEAITPKTKAIMGVHLFGQPFDVDAVQEICDDHNILLFEDAAQAHGAEYHGRRVGGLGGLGTFGSFSFYPTKNMTTGEGGMVTTNDPEIARKTRLLVNHGQAEKYLHTAIGYNFRMTDIGAAIGLVQLGKLEGFNERRTANARYYDEHLTAPGVVTPYVAPGGRHVYHQYVATVGDECPLTRDELMAYLGRQGVGSAVHYPIPVQDQPVYRAGQDAVKCPVSSQLARQVLSLPVHPGIGIKELEQVCDAVNRVKEAGR
ncbi:DegT/DnrJ/EryC1/StrS family aminotransferase [Methanoculleus sp. FWC-SCC1]|uniref:DegT/DnrJ/EryC1/StrS family aminotransferase n=1 Tax=Methanoculleus frigidifontis TaxID=2584085 RepID=A0ABT8MC63_9EURY|nr:DegT/DnrJ/EryC1/StrS family aminotransferase [Methanoculleus sp. FWC-SCC1]MDN7025471.1 DegT/DnrJ/EryC1/StrS family aminotransferase [Methanoculleus sp. FWC-SCC1]